MPFLISHEMLFAYERPLCASSGVATKLRCPLLCKVKMSLGSLAGSVSRRRGDLHIAAAPASAGGFWARFGGAGSGPGLKAREPRSETKGPGPVAVEPAIHHNRGTMPDRSRLNV